MNAGTASGKDPLPRAMRLCHEEPDLDWLHRRRRSPQRDEAATNGAEKRLRADHHGGDAPGLDVLRALSAPAQDGTTMTAPVPRLTYEAVTAGVTGDTQMAGLEALLSLSTVQDVPATAQLPRVWKSAGDERQTTTITALIPAHNEETTIAATIESVLAQTRVPDQIMVMCDNCTDRTAEIASRYEGVTVTHSRNNTGRKAGALNRALDVLLPPLNDDDLVLCIDADTTLHPDLIANAQRHFRREPAFGAVSANHTIRSHGNLLEMIQVIEYERDRRHIGRRQGVGGCMSGASTVFRVKALRALYQKYGEVYTPGAWTEDWMITYALKHQGFKLLKPQDCMVKTAPVPRWGRLFKQRQRWSHGYVESIAHFGLTRYTALPWLGLVFWAFSLTLWGAWLLLMGQMLSHGRAFHIQLWVAAVTALFVYARVYTVRRCGGRAMLLAGLMLPEIIYGWWTTAACTSGLVKHFTGINGQWDSVKTTIGKHRRARTVWPPRRARAPLMTHRRLVSRNGLSFTGGRDITANQRQRMPNAAGENSDQLRDTRVS